MTFYVDTRHANCSREICRLLKTCILEQTQNWSEICLLYTSDAADELDGSVRCV